MNLSSLRCNEIGKFPDSDEEFIVVDRYPEDRSSGGTTITYNDGSRKTYYWDHENPEVRYIGRGRLEARIVHDGPAKP